MEPNSDGVPRAPSASGSHRPTWLLVLEFIAAAVIVAMLVAGPQIWEASGKLKDEVQQYLNRPSNPADPISPLQVSPPVKMPSKSPAVRAASAPQAPGAGAGPVQAPPPAAAPAQIAAPAPIRTDVPPRPGSQPITLRPRRETATRPPVAAATAGRWKFVPASEVAAAAAASSGLSPQQYFDSLMRQGYELYQAGWYGPAMGRFRQAALVMPSSPSPLLWQARSAMKVGRYGEARVALERVIALAPTSPAAREARVMLEGSK